MENLEFVWLVNVKRESSSVLESVLFTVVDVAGDADVPHHPDGKLQLLQLALHGRVSTPRHRRLPEALDGVHAPG